MSSESLSHSQSLRAIGQSLEVLGIHSFHLAKRGEDYLVRAAAEVTAWLPLWRRLESHERNHEDATIISTTFIALTFLAGVMARTCLPREPISVELPDSPGY
jgi:hypothetical protein